MRATAATARPGGKGEMGGWGKQNVINDKLNCVSRENETCKKSLKTNVRLTIHNVC